MGLVLITQQQNSSVSLLVSSGPPRITLEFAGQFGYAGYTGAGSATGQILFGYVVLVGDNDAVGVSLKGDSLALDGGTIQATDDSAEVTLTHPATTFASHEVDTEVLILGNGDWDDRYYDVTVSVTHEVCYEFRLHEHRGCNITKVTLNVKTPSDTLDVVLYVGNSIDRAMEFTYTGSVNTAGLQTFTLSQDSPHWPNVWADQGERFYYIHMVGEGSGSIELEAKDCARGQDPPFPSTVPPISFSPSTRNLTQILIDWKPTCTDTRERFPRSSTGRSSRVLGIHRENGHERHRVGQCDYDTLERHV